VEEEAAVDAEDVAEGVVGDGDHGADDRAQQWGDGVDPQPFPGAATIPRLAEDEADGVEPVGEVVADDGDEDEEAGGAVESEGEPDPESVDEAVDGEPEGAEHPDAMVGAGVGGVVAVVEHQ